MIGSRKIALEFSVNWLIVICLAALGLIVAFVLGPVQWRPALIFTASALIGTGALLAAVNALDARVAQLRQVKMVAAFDFMHRWNDPQFFYAKRNGREILGAFRGQNIQEQKAYLNEEPARLANLLDVLNVFEAMSIAIQTEVADEDIAKRAFRSLVLEYWHVAEGFIKDRRAERGNARLLRELEWLFTRWKD